MGERPVGPGVFTEYVQPGHTEVVVDVVGGAFVNVVDSVGVGVGNAVDGVAVNINNVV